MTLTEALDALYEAYKAQHPRDKNIALHVQSIRDRLDIQSRGGRTTSEARAEASRLNGAKGGRPKGAGVSKGAK